MTDGKTSTPTWSVHLRRKCSPFALKQVVRFYLLENSMTIENPHSQNRRVNLKGYPLYSANDVATWPRIDWLVEGIIQRRSSAVIFGESRIGKSFLALDLATKLANGEDWFGYSVKPSKVIYFPAESPLGLYQRIEAMRIHSAQETPENLLFMRSTVDLGNDDDVNRVIATVSNSSDVLFIDTFNAVASSSDENSSKEMGKILNGVRRVIDETGCTVIFVHHCGWSDNDRLRGHSSFSAAMDTRILVSKESGHPAWKVKGQREGADTGAHRYELRVIELQELDCTSCVVVPIDAIPAKKISPQPRSENQKTCLRVVKDLSAKTQNPIKLEKVIDEASAFIDADVKHKRQRAAEAITSLTKSGFLDIDQDEFVTLRC
jgi:hypothetical protein